MLIDDYIDYQIKYQEKYGSLAKENLPLKPKIKPELDNSPLVDETKHKEYQHIIGVCQWLIVAGRFDLTHAISSLSRFAAAPREGHLELARKVFGYLKKYPKRGYAINPTPLKIDVQYEEVELKLSFGNQYSYFREEMDPRFPEPLFDEFGNCRNERGHRVRL